MIPTNNAEAAYMSKNHHATIPYFRHVFVIVMENHSYNDIMYEHDVPYIHQLAQRYGLATQYYGVTNPSVGDRVALLSGTTAGTELPQKKTTGLTQNNLVDQLTSHHLTWGAFYQHSRVSSSANPLYNYQHGHSTFLRFADIANNAARVADLHPLRQLSTDIASNRVPNFVWIAPNSLGNMEGGYRTPGQFTFQGAGPGGATSADSQLEQGGNSFLKTWIPRITHSRAWHSGPSAIFIAFDETSYDASNPSNGFWLSNSAASGSPVLPAGTNLSGNPAYPFSGGVDGGGHAVALVVTNTSHHVVSATSYNEYSILKTIETGWHLGFLQNTANPAVNPMNAFFGSPTHYQGSSVQSSALPGYARQLADTPVIAPTSPAATSSSLANISATTNPYLALGENHQVAATVTVKEQTAGVLSGSLTINLPTGRGVTFSVHSHPTGTTAISNPSDVAVQFAPATIGDYRVTLPIATISRAPSTGIISGIDLNVGTHASSGPVVATLTADGRVLGTVTLGSVGKPRAGAVPQMMAPVAMARLTAFPFVPALSAQSHNPHYVMRIEGQYPTAQAQDSNQYALFKTISSAPTVLNPTAFMTSQAGKQYWVQVRREQAPHQWSVPATFSVNR